MHHPVEANIYYTIISIIYYLIFYQILYNIFEGLVEYILLKILLHDCFIISNVKLDGMLAIYLIDSKFQIFEIF